MCKQVEMIRIQTKGDQMARDSKFSILKVLIFGGILALTVFSSAYALRIIW